MNDDYSKISILSKMIIKFKKNISIVRLKRVMGIIDEYVSINDEKYHLGP